jgi:hypothetical protein
VWKLFELIEQRNGKKPRNVANWLKIGKRSGTCYKIRNLAVENRGEMGMRKCLLAIVATLVLSITSAHARPQLHTQSIGWINPADLQCEATSDHICAVKADSTSTALTFASPTSDKSKYRVLDRTELVILDDRGNDLFYHKDKSKGRVEVAIERFG